MALPCNERVVLKAQFEEPVGSITACCLCASAASSWTAPVWLRSEPAWGGVSAGGYSSDQVSPSSLGA